MKSTKAENNGEKIVLENSLDKNFEQVSKHAKPLEVMLLNSSEKTIHSSFDIVRKYDEELGDHNGYSTEREFMLWFVKAKKTEVKFYFWKTDWNAKHLSNGTIPLLPTCYGDLDVVFEQC